MRLLQNVLVGFAVSLFGALPFGTINITAYYLSEAGGNVPMIQFIAGVAIVEFAVVFALLKGVRLLERQSSHIRLAEWGSVLLLVVLGVSFLSFGDTQRDAGSGLNAGMLAYPPFLIGLFVSGANLMQLPFWAGWNLFLTRNAYIHPEGVYKYGYVAGISAGTSVGVMLFVSLFGLVGKTGFGQSVIDLAMPAMCFLLAAYQLFKMFQKSSLSNV